MPKMFAGSGRLAAWHWIVAASVIIVIGAGLRLFGSRGDLWLDEIWTLVLLKPELTHLRAGPAEPVTSFWQIFFINHVNNHFLNSIYLYLVGPDASSPAQRALSVVLGIAVIVAAGLASMPNGLLAALAAMLTFAVCYPMVHYGSEARGYTGLVLFCLVALIYLQRELERPHWSNRLFLSLAVGLGFLSHLTMAAPAVIFALWTAWATWERTGSLRQAEAFTRSIFLPALIWPLAIAAAIVFGRLHHRSFSMGGGSNIPSGLSDFVEGYGGLIRLLLGLPEQVPAWACLVATISALLAAAYLWRHRDDYRVSLYVLSIVILPAVMLASRLPNLHVGRYFLFSGTMFLLFLADALGRAWQKRGLQRSIAVAALLAILAGNAASLRLFFERGRGHYADAVAQMAAATGSFAYSSDHYFRNSMLVDFFSRKLGVSARYVMDRDWCQTPPDWMVIHNIETQRRFAAEVVRGPPECTSRFTLQSAFPAWGLSGWQWVLYRRVPGYETGPAGSDRPD